MPHFFFKILQVWCSNFCGQLKIYSSSPLFLSGFFFFFQIFGTLAGFFSRYGYFPCCIYIYFLLLLIGFGSVCRLGMCLDLLLCHTL